jgi:Na+/H+ antiporter NhaD/arsenite permease-like protein
MGPVPLRSRGLRVSACWRWPSASCSFDDAFSGFSNDIVIIVASALMVSAGRGALRHRGTLRSSASSPNLTSKRSQLALLLVLIVAVISAFIKNIGALAIMMPLAFQFARKSGTSPSEIPHAYGVRVRCSAA